MLRGLDFKMFHQRMSNLSLIEDIPGTLGKEKVCLQSLDHIWMIKFLESAS